MYLCIYVFIYLFIDRYTYTYIHTYVYVYVCVYIYRVTLNPNCSSEAVGGSDSAEKIQNILYFCWPPFPKCELYTSQSYVILVYQM